MTLVHGTAAVRVCVLALVLGTARGFYATSLACCEKKCSAAGLDQEATTACRMHGCMMRWNGDTTSQCAATCMSQATTSQKEACLTGCKNFAACDCTAGDYFSEPEAWASKGAKDTCRACPAGYACTGAQAAPAACKPGHWASGASKACLTCAAGRYGTGESTTPQCSGTCAAGRFGRPGAASPQCHGGCVVKPGQYAIEAAAETGCALPCPAGRFGRGDSLDPHCSGPCPAGRWSAAGSPACKACPAGTYGDSEALQTPECTGLCPAGRFSDDGATKCQDAKEAAQEAARKAKQEAAAAVAKKEGTANKLGGTMRTIRGQVGMTRCNSGERLVCSTTIACKVSVGVGGHEQAANCPQSTQFAGHYVKLMTENCKCDATQKAKGTTMPTLLAPGQCKNGDKVVDDQWTGVGEGSNWCNHCLCSNGRLVCTTMACSAQKPAAVVTSTTPAPPQSAAAAAKVAHFGSQCVNGATIVEDGWTGLGKAENAQCKMCVCDAKKNVYVRCSTNDCAARHTTASPSSLDWMTMCKLRDSTNSTKARFVADGWTGPGMGKDWCNRCMCSKTRLSCTKMACGADPNVCKNGHDTVPYGWIGRGKGMQWCNMCRCDEQHGIVCAPKVCGPNPNPTSETPKDGANAEKPPSDHDGCMNGALRVADGWEGEGAGSQWCNRCTCAAGKLSCQEKKTCPPRACNGVMCPAVAPTCLSPATMVKPKTAWAGCCFDETHDCASATVVTTYAGRYVAMAPYLDNGGTMLVTRTETLCHTACLSSSDCIAGTYIISGTHKGECWLSSHVHKVAHKCDKPCSSFAKRPGAPRTHPNLPVIQAKKAPEAVAGAQCRCSPAHAPASKIVDCKADVLGNHIRVHHLGTRFHHWKAQGNEGHVCKLVRVPTQSSAAKHGEHLCARRNSLGDCIEFERFECRCCDCVPGGVPASIRMLGTASHVSENLPLLPVAPGVNTLELCAEECVKTAGCLAGDFGRDGGKPVCRLSAHLALSSGQQHGVQGFAKKTAVTSGSRVVAVPVSCGPAGCKHTELVNTEEKTVTELDANAGTYYAAEPYIGSGPSQEADVQRCEARCAQEKNCQVGTYITAGSKRGQCWLSSHALPQPLLCSSPCQSFGKRKLGVNGRSQKCAAAFHETIKFAAGSKKCIQIVHHSLGAAKCDSAYTAKELESACNVAQQV